MQPGRFVYLGAMRAFDTDWMAHKAQNVYSLALYEKVCRLLIQTFQLFTVTDKTTSFGLYFRKIAF